jgi:RNA polymerase sigma factor (sigma-70 family)
MSEPLLTKLHWKRHRRTKKVLQVNEALDQLANEDPQKAEIVKLRFFAGMQHQEVAALLDVNEKTVRRHWELAKVRLFQLMRTVP